MNIFCYASFLEIFCNLIHNSSKIYFYVSISTFPICIKFILCHSCNDIILYVLVCVSDNSLQMLIIFIHTILFNYNSLIHIWIIFQRLIYLYIHSIILSFIYSLQLETQLGHFSFIVAQSLNCARLFVIP